MLQYIFRRILLFLPVLLAISFINFALYSMAPGDPITAMYSHMLMEGGSSNLTGDAMDSMRARLGLDQPWPVRYGVWLSQMLRGNFGRSLTSQREVSAIILKALWPTVQLNLIAITIGVLIGVGLGVVQALKQYSVLDYVLSFLSFFYISLPGFFLALLLIYVFALQLGWFPAAGYETVGAPPSWQDRLQYKVLPVMTLSLASAPGLMRITRTSVLEVLGQPFITTARAKGLVGQTVVWRHVFRNSLIPVTTYVGSVIPGIIGGSIIIEQIFAWPGMGRLALRAAFERDYPLLMGLVMVSAVVLLVSILLIDIVYAALDPRIHYGAQE